MPNRPNFPIPEEIHAETFCLCLQIPNDPTWKQVVKGLLDELNQWYNWQRDDENSGRECAHVWRPLYNQIDWTTMSCCCDDTQVMARFTEDGHYQTSDDGGVTWVDAPTEDPRYGVPQLPPNLPESVEDKKCVYADSIVNQFKEGVIDVIEEGDNIQTIVAILTGIAAAIFGTLGGPLGILAAILAAVAAGIVTLGVTAVKGAFTEEVWNDLRCLIRDNMNDDGTFTQSQVDNIYNNVPGDIIASTVLRSWIAFLGVTGMINASHLGLGALDADCSDCDEIFHVYWQNDGLNLDTSADEIFPDEEGVYTVTCDIFNINGYYGIVKFAADPTGDGYIPCSSITITSTGGSSLGFLGDCETGSNNALSTCWSFMQRYGTSSWTMTFTLLDPCSP